MLCFYTALVLLMTINIVKSAQDCYESTFLSPIPSDHLFHKKTKPLVLGHRGNPRLFQENTLDGFKSLLDTNADGFELDILNKLVLFHDDNTKMLTGEDHVMWETNAKDLTNVHILKSIDYNGRIFNFTKSRPLPMLKDVLEAMKDSGKLMYLEIKPSYLRDMNESVKVGKSVAKMVTDMGLAKQAVINSFDPFKALSAKQENPEIPVGFFYTTKYWRSPYPTAMKQGYALLPGMEECIKGSPNGTAFTNKLFENGAAMKSINASFLEMDYKIYNNPLYSNNTFEVFRKNYSPKISAGAWTLYNMKNSEEEDERQDEVIDRLIQEGAERLITDDVYRMLKKLGRPESPPTALPVGPTNAGSQVIIGIMVELVVLFSVAFVF